MKSFRRVLFIGLGVVTGAALLSFALLNQGEATLDFFLISDVSMPIWLLVLACVGVGWLIPRLLRIGLWFQWRRERKLLEKRVGELEQEVVALRNIPLELEPKGTPEVMGPGEPVKVRAVTAIDVSERVGGPALLPAGSDSAADADDTEMVTES